MMDINFINADKKVLIVCDVEWWCFNKIYKGIKKNISTDWEVDAVYINNGDHIDHKKYNVILWLCDFAPHLIIKYKIPKEKLIFCMRQSHFINHPVMTNFRAYCSILSVANKKIYDSCIGKHDNIVLAPGGVDTDIFYYEKKIIFPEKIRVGWTGSRDNFNNVEMDYRGLNIIETACNELGYIFTPAIREEKLRTEQEMINYYHNDIDIYVDMSLLAGRQNGLVEAGSCGLPCISYSCGIATDLIENGISGFISYRNVESLKEKLTSIISIANRCGENIRKNIENQWSWKVQVDIFEKMFNSIVGQL